MNTPNKGAQENMRQKSTKIGLSDAKWMVFTDLDGTLLDHHSYAFGEALQTIERLQALNVPIVICTSKTLSECLEWQQYIGLDGPVVYENGAGIALPKAQLKNRPSRARDETPTHYFCGIGLPYAKIRETVIALRDEHGYDFQGYGDLKTEDVMALTGLDFDSATRSQDRHYTEPLVWSDSEAAKQAFIQQLTKAGFISLQGGRFLHVTSNADKGTSMLATVELSSGTRVPQTDLPKLVALGDSSNDTAMLQRAQAAVVIRRHDGTWMPYKPSTTNHTVIKTEAIGPAGWAEAINQLLIKDT